MSRTAPLAAGILSLLCLSALAAAPPAETASAPAALTGPAAATNDRFNFIDAWGKYIDVFFDGRRVLRHMYAYDVSTPERAHETYKPYTHVFDAEGQEPITKGPGGLYTHHRGIFIGWNKLGYDNGKVNDWWHMKGVSQVHQKFLEQTEGPAQARLAALVHWNDGEGKPVVIEERTLTVFRQPAPTIALLWFESKLTAARSDVRLDGDPEHAGVHFRPANEVDAKATRYVFPQEGTDPKSARDLAWAAETFKLGDRLYSVLHMNHPANPKGTAYSAYRDYGRFGAFFSATIRKGETLPLRYGFWVVAGDMPAREALQARWEAAAATPPQSR